MQTKPKFALVALAVLALTGARAFGGDDSLATASLQESVAHQDRLAEIEAELAAVTARLDRLPSTSATTSHARSRHSQACGAYAGYAFVFARPHFSENVSYTINDQRAQRPFPDVTTLVPFSSKHEVTPRVWLGFVGASGFGVRWRYWQFDHDGHEVSPVNPGYSWEAKGKVTLPIRSSFWPQVSSYTGRTLSVTHGLEVHASDLEVTRQMMLRGTSITLSGGLRYARMDQDYRAADVDLSGQVYWELNANRSFKAIGPTVGVELRHPIGSWAIYGGARGSVLLGETDFRATDPTDVYVWDDSAESMGVAEAEVGLEWTRPLSSGSYLFVRGGYEGQLWLGAGSPNSLEGDLGFEGFSLAFGFAR